MTRRTRGWCPSDVGVQARWRRVSGCGSSRHGMAWTARRDPIPTATEASPSGPRVGGHRTRPRRCAAIPDAQRHSMPFSTARNASSCVRLQRAPPMTAANAEPLRAVPGTQRGSGLEAQKPQARHIRETAVSTSRSWCRAACCTLAAALGEWPLTELGSPRAFWPEPGERLDPNARIRNSPCQAKFTRVPKCGAVAIGHCSSATQASG